MLAAFSVSCGPLVAAGFSQPDARAQPDLFAWTDTCNVYVLRDGEAALLVNLGDGSVLEHLSEIGVKRVEWAKTLACKESSPATTSRRNFIISSVSWFEAVWHSDRPLAAERDPSWQAGRGFL